MTGRTKPTEAEEKMRQRQNLHVRGTRRIRERAPTQRPRLQQQRTASQQQRSRSHQGQHARTPPSRRSQSGRVPPQRTPQFDAQMLTDALEQANNPTATADAPNVPFDAEIRLGAGGQASLPPWGR